MSRSKDGSEDTASSQKRKADSQDEQAEEQIEIDINAPEPPSKKALRKAKRQKTLPPPTQRSALSNSLTPIDITKKSNGHSAYGIWIGNLPFFVTKTELQTFLIGDSDSPIAEEEVTRINLPTSAARNGPKPQNKGFAYVDLATEPALHNALKLSEKLLGGRRVLIKNAKDFEGRPDSRREAKGSDATIQSSRIFVGNLGFDITKEDLESHFHICGTIDDVHMATFEDTGKCKGYAWIEFDQITSAEAAMRGWVETAVPGTQDDDSEHPKRKRIWVNQIQGRKLRMEFAEDKATRYNKRFRKSALQKGDGYHEAANGEDSVKKGAPVSHVEALERRHPNPRDTETRKGKSGSKYPASIVSRLKGTIVAGQGTKTTFD